MPVQKGVSAAVRRQNRRWGLALGLAAILFYAAIAIRWAQGF